MSNQFTVYMNVHSQVMADRGRQSGKRKLALIHLVEAGVMMEAGRPSQVGLQFYNKY